jgi:Family of unknown function (DUF6186)
MAVTAAWLALVGLAAAWEIRCHLGTHPPPGMTDLAAAAWRHPVGRVALLAVWAFAGWHVFARYTLPT